MPISICKKSSRPIRFAYLVENSKDSLVILDEIFRNCYERWGGLRSLIVPVHGGNINEDYMLWLCYYDPDIIYSYAQLNPKTRKKLLSQTSPFKFYIHEQSGISSPHPHQPRYSRETGMSALNSLTTISSSSVYKSLEPLILSDSDPIKKELLWKDRISFVDSGFVTDNFGCFSENTLDHVTKAENGFGCIGLQSLKPLSKTKNRGRILSDEISLLNEIAKYPTDTRIYTPAYFSGKYIPYSSIQLSSSFREIKLFIGDSFEDRLNFWNSRFDYSEIQDYDPAHKALRIPMSIIKNPLFVPSLKKFLAQLQQRHQFLRTSLISYSLSTEELRKIKSELDLNKVISCEIISEPENIFPKQFEGSSEAASDYGKPVHLEALHKNLFFLKKGEVWVTEIEIKISDAPHKGIWKLPRRNSICEAFFREKKKLKEISRIGLSGNISFINYEKDSKTALENFSLTNPEDKEIFTRLCPTPIGISDKGRLFQETIKMFGDLRTAFFYLEDPFWQPILEGKSTISKQKIEEKIREKLIKDKRTIGSKRKSKNEFNWEKSSLERGLEFLIKKNLLISKQGSEEFTTTISKQLAESLQEILILGRLEKKSSGYFPYLPQTNIYLDKKDQREMDFLCILNGQFIIGEAKTRSSGFESEVVKKIIKVSNVLHPDKILLTYLEKALEGESAIECAKKEIESAGFSVEIIQLS